MEERKEVILVKMLVSQKEKTTLKSVSHNKALY